MPLHCYSESYGYSLIFCDIVCVGKCQLVGSWYVVSLWDDEKDPDSRSMLCVGTIKVQLLVVCCAQVEDGFIREL